MYNSKIFKVGVGVLLLFLIIYVGVQISFVFRPIVIIFEALFVSFLIAGILYYLTAPLNDFFCSHKVPRSLSVLLVFLVIIALFALLGLAIGPILSAEAIALIDTLPQKAEQLRELLLSIYEHPLLGRFINVNAGSFDYESIAEYISSLALQSVSGLAAGLGGLLDFIGNLLTAVVIVPFLLYYMLKERGAGVLTDLADRYAPLGYRDSVKTALSEINSTLGVYFKGVGIVCLCVGIMAYIGFLVIGLEYALILAIFIMITNVVPFIGPWIGAIPAVLVGLLTSPLLMLQVIIVVVVVQQIESFVITPQVMGRRVALSPLAIILVILIAGRLAGLVGIIIAVPAFTALKITSNHIYSHLVTRQGDRDEAING
jgi:predicted PurR-regulated permease PerM